MRKLKVALIVLLACLLSIGLFACKKKGDDDGVEVSRVTVRGELEFTDADTSDALAAKLAALDVRITNSADVIKGSECTVENGDNIKWGQVGTYYITLVPTKNNPQNMFDRCTVHIDHAFDSTGTCTHCQATESTVEASSPETLHIGLFHDGANTLTSSEAQIIKPYGTLPVDGYGNIDVRTFTVGRLTKGTKITIKGNATTDDGSSTTTWYFPILGVADGSTGTYIYDSTKAGAGTSVFVRNEGWVLLNGVGTETNRMLAALAGGSTETPNYGSLISISDSDGVRPTDYYDWSKNFERYAVSSSTVVNSYGTPLNADVWKDWYVYSEGTQLYTQDYAPNDEGVGPTIEASWFYRPDGVVEMTLVTNDSATLVMRVKVPDGADYYDALIHGECMTWTINSMTTVSPLTLTNINAEVTKTDYVSNQMFDMSKVTVKAQYEQSGSEWKNTDLFNVYGIRGDVSTVTGYEFEGQPLYGTVYDLSKSPVLSSFTHYVVSLTVGNITKYQVFEAKDVANVATNAAYEAVALDGSETDVTGYSLALVDGKAVFTLEAIAETAASADGLPASYTKVVKFVIYANSDQFADKFTPNLVYGLKADNTGSDNEFTYGYKTAADGSYMEVIIGLKASDNENVMLGSVQGTELVIDVSKVQGLAVTSTASSANLALNEGGKVTVVYTSGTQLNGDNAYVDFGSSTTVFFAEGESSGIYSIESLTEEQVEGGYKYTVVYVIGGVNLANGIAPVRIQLKSMETFGLLLTQNIINYTPKFVSVNGDNGAVLDAESGDNLTYAQLSGSTLYVARIVSDYDNIESCDLAISELKLNINAGDKSKLAIIDLSGIYANGYRLNDADLTNVTANVYVLGTLDDDRDIDNFAVVVFAIDLTKLDSSLKANDGWHFEIYNPDSEAAYYFNADSNAVAQVSATYTTDDNKGGFEEVGTKLVAVEGQFVRCYLVTPQHGFAAVAEASTGVRISEDGSALLVDKDLAKTLSAAQVQGLYAQNEDAESLVDTGLTISFWVYSTDSDWNSTAVSTATGGLNITLPNLDSWSVTAGNSGTDEMKALASALYRANAFPGIDANNSGAESGFAWDSFLNNECYVTITISKTEGIKYYHNGELAIFYNADANLNYNNSGVENSKATASQFAELFLLCAQTYGLKIDGASKLSTMKNVIVEARTASAEGAKLLYDNYLLSEAGYPAGHVHVYDPVTYKCSCGALNPVHGDPSTGKDSSNDGMIHTFVNDVCKYCGKLSAKHVHTFEENGWNCDNDACPATNPDHEHVYDENVYGGHRCTLCGVLNPEHEHEYENGVCECGTVCTHTWKDGVCEICGATQFKPLEAGWDVTQGKMLTLADGEKYIVTGKYGAAGGAAYSGMTLVVTTEKDGTEYYAYFLQAACDGGGSQSGEFDKTAGDSGIQWGLTSNIKITAGKLVTNKLNHTFSYEFAYKDGTFTILYNLYDADGILVLQVTSTFAGLEGNVNLYAVDDGNILANDVVGICKVAD